MSAKHLRLDSHRISNDAWWYEEPKGICVVIHLGTKGAVTVDIPWRQIRAAIKRLDKCDE